MSEPIFEPDGELWVPTEYALGPWGPEALHGGAPAALMARAIESVSAEGPMQVARVSVELLRPVLRAPLSVDTRIVRPGRKVQLIEAQISQAANVVARAVGLKVRELPIELPPEATAGAPPSPPEEAKDMSRGPWVGFGKAHEIRLSEGWLGAGPTRCWFRLRHPLVPGEDPSPLSRVMAAADFGNGISSHLDFREHAFINPDLTVHLNRQPEDEWICLDARTEYGPNGIAVASSRLLDRRGDIGRSTQALLIDRRGE